MGHNRVGRLPRSHTWLQVIELTRSGESALAIANATLHATSDVLDKAGKDEVVAHVVWLLTQLPEAARKDDFGAALSELGIEVGASPSLLRLTSAFSEAVDEKIASLDGSWTDLGEMARLAAVETLSKVITPRIPALFGQNPADVKSAVRELGTESQFGYLAREFFGRFTERILSYFVSRELPLHIGAGQRFGSIEEQRAFQQAIGQHALQAAGILEQYAGEWYSKKRFQDQLSPQLAGNFVSYAMYKMRSELQRGAA